VQSFTGKAFYVQVGTVVSDLHGPSQVGLGYFIVSVCGNESILLNDTRFGNLEYSYRQGSGNANITRRNLLFGGRPFANSSEPWCPVETYELYYFDSASSQNLPYSNTTVAMDKKSGYLTFNTTVPTNETLLVKVNSFHGSKPLWVDFAVSIIGLASYDWNAPPMLTEPPEGANIVINRMTDLYSASFKISPVYDDRDEPAYLNFTSRGFGRLSYRFEDEYTAVLDKNLSKYMTYDPATTEMTI
jgi:hypothetical protein